MIFKNRGLLIRKGLTSFTKITLTNNHTAFFCRSKSVPLSLVKTAQKTIQWNLKSLDSHSCQVDLLVVLNNPNFNLPWLKLVAAQASSIILVDGGANIFHSLQLALPEQSISKVKAVIGDLDSVNSEVQNFYKSKNVQIIKDSDQEKNDFEKTLKYGKSLGSKSILVSGAFGNRIDHTFMTMSLTEKTLNQNPQINMILTNASSIYMPLRTGFKHRITLSDLINRIGCGLMTFQSIQNVSTQGFKWNLGNNQLHNKIQWGGFLSTSNQIIKDDLIVDLKDKTAGFANLVASLKQNQK